MRLTPLFLPPLAAALMACSPAPADGSGSVVARSDGQGDGSAQLAMAQQDGSSSPGSQQANPAEHTQSDQYQLLGITDPDLGMVAAAMKIPSGWLAKQTFQREWKGAMPSNKIYVVFRSPDASQQVEYFPNSQYVYSDGPGPNSLRMQSQSMGIDAPLAENELQPMTGLAYLKRYVLPQMAQNGAELREIGNERETAPHSVPTPGSNEPHMASSASVDGVLPNGNQARIEVRLGWYEARNGQDVFYSWWATPSITQTGNGDLAATYAHAETAQASMAYNPEWLRKNKQLQDQGNEATLASMRSNHEAAMENIAQWGRISRANSAASMARIKNSAAASAARQDEMIASSNARMAQNDRANELFTDVVINGEAKYSNPTTGERVKVDNSYNHTYTDSSGNYLQSNAPLEPGNLDWQEMEKVQYNDY